MVAWSCDDCRRRPGLLEARGRCGGPFSPALKGAQRDERGLYVEGADVCSAATGTFRRVRFHACPAGEALGHDSPVIEALELFRRAGEGGARLSALVEAPSAQAFEALEVLEDEVQAIRELQREIRRRSKA